MLGRAASTCATPVRRRCASAYRAGATLDDALGACRRLAVHGLRSAVGYAAARGQDADSVAAAHLSAFDRLGGEDMDCYVSVKLSALGFDAGRFADLESAAARAGRRLHLDAVDREAVGPTWGLLDGATGKTGLGTTLPGRWRRSVDDAARAAELGLAVRVVKGQWPDTQHGDLDPRQGFLDLADRLRGHTGGIALATHDVLLLEEALRRLAAAGTPCEVELFCGLPFRGPALAARRAGVPIRMYVPYGHAGAPYAGRQVVTNRAAVWWLAQDLVLGEQKTWRSIRRTFRHA